MKKLLIPILCSSILFGEDLRQVYDLALKNDPSYQSAKEAYLAGEEVEYQGYSVLMPRVDISASSGYTDLDIKYNQTTPNPSIVKYNSSAYSANLIWPIFRKDSIELYRGSKVLLRQAVASFDSAKQALILKVAGAYFDLLLAQENMELLGAQRKSIQSQLDEAKLNFKLGNATALEINEAQAKFDQIVARELLSAQDVLLKKDLLENLTLQNIEHIAKLGDSMDEKVFETKSIEQLKDSALQSPLLKKAKEQVEFARLEYERSKSGFFPTVDAIASRGKTLANSSIQGIGSEQSSSYVGISLNFNLFNGGYNLSKTREALANKNKIAFDYEALKRDITNQALQSYLGVNTGLSQLKASKQALESARLSLDSTKTGVSIGLRNSNDLLNAEQAYFDAKKAYSVSKYALIMSSLRLKSFTNELTIDDLDKINQLTKK